MNSEANPLLGRLRELSEQVAAREGCRLYDLEFVGGSKGRGRVLRVYIDKPNTTVGVDDCANVSRGLNLLLDVEDAMPGGAYVLEVSSPGLERPLRQPWHFKEAVGKNVQVKLEQAIEAYHPDIEKMRGAKSFRGLLKAVDEGPENDGHSLIATLVHDGTEVKFPIAAATWARTVFEFEKAQPKGGAHKQDKKKHKGRG